MDQPPFVPPASFPSSPSPSGGPQPSRRKPLSFWIALFFAGCSALGGIAVLLLFLGMGPSMGAMGSGLRSNRYQEQEIEGKGRDKIAWIPVHGILLRGAGGGGLLGGSSPDPVEQAVKALELAGDDPQVKAVILDVDTPGGGITESDILHHAVDRLRSEHMKKVVVLMGDVAASGGYYVSAGADHIMAHPTSITGSIGVISEFMNMEALFDKVGMRWETFRSGPMKDLGSSSRPMTAEDRKVFQDLVDDMYGKFLAVVLEGRRHIVLPDRTPFTEAHLKRVADGRIYTADQALALGLIDGIGYREDAIAQAKVLSGVQEARIVQYAYRPPGLFELLGARAPAAPTVLFDPRAFVPVAPRLLFLWTRP